MPQPSFEMEESRSVTPWINRLYFESPRASSFLGLRLVKARHKNLISLFSGVKPDPMVGSGRYAESIPVKSPLKTSQCLFAVLGRPCLYHCIIICAFRNLRRLNYPWWTHSLMIHVTLVTELPREVVHCSWLSQITRFIWPKWGPPGSCQLQMGPM